MTIDFDSSSDNNKSNRILPFRVSAYKFQVQRIIIIIDVTIDDF